MSEYLTRRGRLMSRMEARDARANMVEIHAHDGVTTADGAVELWRRNYDGAMSDLDASLDMLSALIDGRTTPERAAEWMRLNYPKRSERDE